jgi:hypothetical protein
VRPGTCSAKVATAQAGLPQTNRRAFSAITTERPFPCAFRYGIADQDYAPVITVSYRATIFVPEPLLDATPSRPTATTPDTVCRDSRRPRTQFELPGVRRCLLLRASLEAQARSGAPPTHQSPDQIGHIRHINRYWSKAVHCLLISA